MVIKRRKIDMLVIKVVRFVQKNLVFNILVVKLKKELYGQQTFGVCGIFLGILICWFSRRCSEGLGFCCIVGIKSFFGWYFDLVDIERVVERKQQYQDFFFFESILEYVLVFGLVFSEILYLEENWYLQVLQLFFRCFFQ